MPFVVLLQQQQQQQQQQQHKKAQVHLIEQDLCLQTDAVVKMHCE